MWTIKYEMRRSGLYRYGLRKSGLRVDYRSVILIFNVDLPKRPRIHVDVDCVNIDGVNVDCSIRPTLR